MKQSVNNCRECRPRLRQRQSSAANEIGHNCLHKLALGKQHLSCDKKISKTAKSTEFGQGYGSTLILGGTLTPIYKVAPGRGSLHSPNQLDLFSHFDTDHKCDGQMDTQTELLQHCMHAARRVVKKNSYNY